MGTRSSFTLSEKEEKKLKILTKKLNIDTSKLIRKIIDEFEEAEELKKQIAEAKKKEQYWKEKYTETLYNDGIANI